MRNHKKFIEKINNSSSKITSLIAITTVIIVYYFYLSIIDGGTSCDEGYYLVGYMDNQKISGVSDFHIITRTLFGWLGDDPALGLRYVRYILTLVSLLIFTIGTFNFLKKRYKTPNSELVKYGSLIYLAGAMSFTFASPILYYDSIQMILYLAIFGLFFGAYAASQKTYLVNYFLIGFLSLYALTNYLPSGILMCGVLITFHFLLTPKNNIAIITAIIAFIISIIVYNHFFSPACIWIERVIDSLNTAEISNSRHDNNSLLFNAFEYILTATSIVVGIGFIYGLSKIYLDKFNSKLIWFIRISIAATTFLIAFRYYQTIASIIFLIPISISITEIIIDNVKKGKRWSDICIIIILLLIPLCGVFGTNQRNDIKAMFFIPFYILALYIILSKTKEYKGNHIFYILWVTILFATTYIFNGHFKRHHYYYSPHKASSVKLKNTAKFTEIKIAPQQAEFIEKINSILRSNGYQEGDRVLAFEEHLILTYAIGATPVEDLQYSNKTFATTKDFNKIEAPNFIILFQRDIEYFSEKCNDSWKLLEDYNKYDIGLYASNLPNPDCRTIIFCKKNITNIDNIGK